MSRLLPLILLLSLIGHGIWLMKKRKDDRNLLIYLIGLITLAVLYYLLAYVLKPEFAIESSPLILFLAVIAFLINSIVKGEQSVASYSAISILCVGGLLYYMIVFLDYEILGSYTLRNIERYDKQILDAKASLDTLENYRKQILNDINKAKMQMQVQLDKIAVYTSEAAQTNLQMQAHLERQKEIEKTITKFDTKLARITEELITFSFLVGNKPLVFGGGIVDEFRHDLDEIPKSLGQHLNFNGDSLLNNIERRTI
jgi:uncharacterized membrane protein YhaH (DUF805 family)